MARIFTCCLAAAACCCCLLLLLPPVQGRRPRPNHGAASGALGSRRRDHLLPVPVPVPVPVPEPHFDATTDTEEHPVKARPTWSAAGSLVRPELRSVPGGPDPLHHHGTPSRRPEQEQERTASP